MRKVLLKWGLENRTVPSEMLAAYFKPLGGEVGKMPKGDPNGLAIYPERCDVKPQGFL
jgi:hypothetical protein